ncbi:MAG TPA: universal stress protein [Bryobacteraceae bacterium]|nr:universal stress protein [Bryobacteraceae bacterium]
MKRALPAAKHLAQTLKASLTIMRVINPFHGGPKPIGEELRSLDPDGMGLDEHHLHVDANSDAATSITNYARERGFDAILVPPAPSAWLSGFSNNWCLTRRLMNTSPCPIWLLRQRAEEVSQELPARRVLCAVTGRDLEVVKMAGALSERLNARLFLLHVIPDIHEGTLSYGFDDHISLTTAHAVKMLARLQEEAGTRAEVIVQTGPVSSNIRKTAERLRADLLVTGRATRSNWFAPDPFPWSMPAAYQTVVV